VALLKGRKGRISIHWMPEHLSFSSNFIQCPQIEVAKSTPRLAVNVQATDGIFNELRTQIKSP
jgi:hypothetical protein